MGKGIGNRRHENCWSYRSTFEKALIISSLLPFIIVVLLVTFLLFQLNFPLKNPNSCTNPVCKLEATLLEQRIDPSTNPCHDFYQFSCGNLWKNKSETSDPFSTIIQESKKQILEIYNEPVKVTDYRIVKAAKQFYKSCLITTELRENDLRCINETLAKLGGWPVVLGSHWNESEFYWIRATQFLRHTGLFYSSFIDVSVISDMGAKSKFILKVAIPEAGQTHIREMNDFIEVATALGAQENITIQDYEEMYKLSLELRREIFLRYGDDPPKKYTVREFQTKYEFINWKEFINNLLGPTVTITDAEEILFDSASGFHQWISFLAKTPKRSQANYMIWKALEPLLPYIQNKLDIYEENRPDFCINEIRERFSPSPLDIAYVQKYLPVSKIRLAKDLVNNMKLEVLSLLDRCDWLDAVEKENAKERVSNMEAIVGAPNNYLDHEVFYQMDIDMNDFNEGNYDFISNLLKITKNYQSRVYQKLSKGPMLKWSLQTGSLIGDYYWEDNIINIPATVLQGSIFDEGRPKYVNYGSIGMLLSHHFFRILIGERAKIFDAEVNTDNAVYQKFEQKFTKCLNLQLNNTYLEDIIMQQVLGFQISYGAYKRSVHSKEDLGFSGYTANQLYWLSAASYFCQPDPNFANIVTNNTSEINSFSNLFLSSISSNTNFGDDFQCAIETKMRPKGKCTIF